MIRKSRKLYHSDSERGSKLPMKEPLVFLCHVVVLESYQHSMWQENNGQSEQLPGK